MSKGVGAPRLDEAFKRYRSEYRKWVSLPDDDQHREAKATARRAYEEWYGIYQNLYARRYPEQRQRAR